MLLQKEETPESQRTGHVKTYKQLSAHPGEKPHQKSTLLHLYLRLPASGPGMRALAGNPTLRVAKAGGSQSSSPVWATSQDCLKKKKSGLGVLTVKKAAPGSIPSTTTESRRDPCLQNQSVVLCQGSWNRHYTQLLNLHYLDHCKSHLASLSLSAYLFYSLLSAQ